MHPPKGSSVYSRYRDWVCSYCKSANPVDVPPEEDDPNAMAALEWSEGFEPPSVEEIEEFWKDEHRRVAEEFAAAASASTSLSAAPELKTEQAGSSREEEGKKGEQVECMS